MKTAKRILSMILAVAVVVSCWIWIAPEKNISEAATEAKDHYLFAYFTGTSKEGQTIHLAVSEDGMQYTALRNNEPVIIPSKGVGNVRDPYIWYNEQDNYYYILATDLDFTDGGGTYSNNSQSFIVWRSKDLVNWYDETFIDVNKMAHLIGDTRGMTAVWAPQVLWDGSAYMIYFTLCCNATGADGTGWNNMQLVYLKTTDIMNQDAYYEFGTLFDPNYHVIDADIIQNPKDGLWYLFYKNEDWDYDTPTTDLKTIHYLIGENAWGPFSTTNPSTGASIDTNGDGRGYRVYPNVTVSLEGCNSYFDADGNLITYTDEYGHTNALGEDEAYFHISKSTDFKTFTMLDDSLHNINSLSPRHGSVVKITKTEYERLLNNSYNITSSSFPETETLEDHLVARYFTTSNPAENTVVGQPDLASVTDIEMAQDVTGEWYAIFNGTSSYAETDFDALFLKTNGLNYEDGFTITFSAYNFPMTSTNSENNDRIYEIANVFGDQSSSTAYYTHFSPSGGGTGSYLGNYNGPVKAGSYDWLADKDGSNRDDNCIHEYIISYATGNVMVYVDGVLVISRNRFTGSTTLDASWYEALGSNATMRIGKSGWNTDPLFEGYMQDLCIYDCSMSYYDAKSLDEDLTVDQGWVGERTYNGITSVAPIFAEGEGNTNTVTGEGTYYDNILYSSPVTNMPWGSDESANPTASTNAAVVWEDVASCYFGVYYAETTVLLLDGKGSATMPVFFGGRINKGGWTSTYNRYFYSVYPTAAYGVNTDNTEIHFNGKWIGYHDRTEFAATYESNSQTMGWKSGNQGLYAQLEDADSQSARNIRYYANMLTVDENNIDFEGKYYKKINLSWQYYGGSSTTYTETDANLKGNKISDNDIYVINFKPILTLRGQITEAEYNSVMNNSALCPELKEKYAAAVYDIRTLDPNNYGFAEAPETATKACAKAIGEAIGTYEGVMAEIAREEAAGSYGHQYASFEAREATCTAYGLTSGKYCVICGEIAEEQTLIAPLPHTFGDVYTDSTDGIQYRDCSVCGTKIQYQPSEVRYENLFSLNHWYNSGSNSLAVNAGSVSTNLTNGTITVKTGGVNYTNVSLAAEKNYSMYSMPVSADKTYVLEFTYTCDATMRTYILAFDKDGNNLNTDNSNIFIFVEGAAGSDTLSQEFTPPENTAYIEIGFYSEADCTMTLSQIGIYTKDSFDPFGETTADARLGFYPGDDKALCYPNPSAGYTFDGWYTSNGALVENVNQLNNPTTIVYGKWIRAGYDITYDSIFSFSDWAKSSCNQLWYGDIYTLNADGTRGTHQSRLISKEGIMGDAEKGTISITWDAANVHYNDTTNGTRTEYCARTNYWIDTANRHVMTVEQNTDYIIEYTITSDNGGKGNICAYLTGGTASYPETGGKTAGTYYFTINSGNNTKLSLRFDNVSIGTTVTYSNIAIYKASSADEPAYFYDHAQNITNRQYRRYYPTEMGIGDVFEYTPVRPGYTFGTWMADTNGDNIGDEDWKTKDDAFVIEKNWHLFSTWTENSYNIAYDANGGTGTATAMNQKYTASVILDAGDGLSRVGYNLIGWSTNPSATVAEYALSATVSKLCGDANGTITLYAIWDEARYNVTFDNLFDLDSFTISTGALTINERTDTGFTITSKSGDDANTGFSYSIPVKSGKTYILSADITFDPTTTGNTYDMYVHALNSSNGNDASFDLDSNCGARVENPGCYIVKSGNASADNFYVKFTAGTTTAQIRIRFDANKEGNKLTVNNIRLCEDKGISVSPVNKYVEYNSTYGELPTPTRDCYDFAGWYNGTTKVTVSSTLTTAGTVYLTSKWLVTDDALAADALVVDFMAPITADPFANDTVFKEALAESTTNATYALNGFSTDGSTASTTLNGTYGSFAVNGYNVVYTPTAVIKGVETVWYHATITTDAGTANVKAQLSVAPASNIFYEETQFTVSNTTGKAWSTVTDADATKITALDGTGIYGYDSSYNEIADYSNGTALKATVDKDNKRSNILSFTFTGSGFQLNGACGPTTGMQMVTIKNNDTGKMVKSYIVDTYYGDSTYGTLYQVPIVTATDLGYGNYTIQVMATYLSFAGALNNNVSSQSVGDMTVYSSADKQAIEAMLNESGIELETDNVEVIWFDDNSVFNGGKGVETQADGAVSTASTTTELINIVDSIRVYEPIQDADAYYIASEQNAQYYNVMDNLVNGGAIIDGSIDGNFAYISGKDNEEISIDTYDAFGSKDELYLSSKTSAVTFTVDGFLDGTSKVMVSFRAASGTPKAKFGDKEITISSNTEMYYDITGYVEADGTVTIQNSVDGTLLAIGTVKLVGESVSTFSTFNLTTARAMMSAEAVEVQPNAPETDSELVGPPAPSDDENDNGTTENKFTAFINKLLELINKIVETIKNLANTVANLLSF